MKKYIHPAFLSFFLLLLVLASCKLKDKKQWDADYLFPIANGELTIRELVDDSIISRNSDNSLKVVYGIPLTELNTADIINVPDTTLPKTVSLKKLELGERKMERRIALGEVARNAGIAGAYIIANHGKSAPIPPFSNLSSGDVDIDAQNFFQEATFLSGKLELVIENEFPIELTDVHYKLRNKTSGTVIAEDTILKLPPKSRYSKTFPLDGKTVEGNLVASIENMSSPGSNFVAVPIDTNDALAMKITAKDLQLYSATAIFPAQNVVEDSIDVIYNLGGAEIVEMKIRTGKIVIEALHTLQDVLHLNYIIPGATLNGVALDLKRTLPAAAIGDTSYASETYPVDGYTVDLTGRNHNTFNTFFNILTARIDSTGKQARFSLDDSIYVFYGLVDVVPEYVRGYLGQAEYIFGNEVFETDAFSQIEAESISLKDVKINLDIENGVGAPAVATLKSLKAVNTKTGKSVNLQSSSVLNKAITIAPALDNPFRPQFTSITLTDQNSNINELLSILPNQLEYSVEIKVNEQGNTKTYSDFLYHESKIAAKLNVEMPLYLGIQGLTLKDTIEVELENIAELENVEKITLYVRAENSFPFDAQLQAYFMNNAGKITDSLWGTVQNRILGGIPDPQSGSVTVPQSSELVIELNKEQFNQLKNTGKLIISSRLNTSGGQEVKIFDSYFLRFKLSARALYRNSF